MSDSYVLSKEQRSFSFDREIPPAIEIDPGDVVTLETSDEQIQRLAGGVPLEEIGLVNFNAVIGPIAVRGAEPGDALRIDILAVTMRSAWSIWVPGFGGLGGRIEKLQIRRLELENGHAQISEAISVPVEPMIGCIGVAPAQGVGSTLTPVDVWGGNMDLRELSPGATLFLPVQVPGALFSAGDLHAAMGRAEATWVSFEGAGQATVRIGLEKNAGLAFPRLRVDEATICVGMGETLEAAHQSAIDQAFDLLVAGGLEPFDAYAYASARVEMRFGGPASPIVLAVVPDR